jgi:hypothetical protein
MTELDCFATRGLNALKEVAARRQIAGGFEKSVRFEPGVFETRRCLFSFAANDLQNDSRDDVLAICRTMNIPRHLVTGINRFRAAAAFVHFGFECSGNQLIGKCYLELPPVAAAESSSGRLQFLGFKWAMDDDSVAVVTRYRSRILSDWPSAASLLLSNAGENVQEAVRTVLTAVWNDRTIVPVPDHTGPSAWTVLELDEEGSDRRSCDLNLCDLAVPLSRLKQPLRAVQAAFQISGDPCGCWLKRFDHCPVGHIATGTGRQGRPFLTVYYDAQHVDPSRWEACPVVL